MSKRKFQNVYKGAGTVLELMPRRRALLGTPKLPPENAFERDAASIRRDWNIARAGLGDENENNFREKERRTRKCAD